MWNGWRAKFVSSMPCYGCCCTRSSAPVERYPPQLIWEYLHAFDWSNTLDGRSKGLQQPRHTSYMLSWLVWVSGKWSRIWTYADSKTMNPTSSCMILFLQPPAISAILWSSVSTKVTPWGYIRETNIPVNTTSKSHHKTNHNPSTKEPKPTTPPNILRLRRKLILRRILNSQKEHHRKNPKHRQRSDLPHNSSHHHITSNRASLTSRSRSCKTTAGTLQRQRDKITCHEDVGVPVCLERREFRS